MAIDYTTWKKQTIFTRGASNPSVTDSEGKYASFYIRYKTTKLNTPGQTKVEWALFKEGREESPTHLKWTIKLSFKSDQTISLTNPIVYEQATRVEAEPNSSGSNHPHMSFRASKNTTPTKTGEFIITHNTKGEGNFKVQAEASIYSITPTEGSVRTISLDNNLPRSACYWDFNSTIEVDRQYIAPGHSFTVSWSGAQPGIDNSIEKYVVYYKINSGSYLPSSGITTTNKNCTITLPNNAVRGGKISIKVDIIGKNLKDAVSKQVNNLGNVNPALDELEIIDYSGKKTKDIFSYKLDEIDISVNLPTKSTGQSIFLNYIVDNNDPIEIENSSFSLSTEDWEEGATKEIKLRATDGEEYTIEQTLSLTKNETFFNRMRLVYDDYLLTSTVPAGCTATLSLKNNNSKSVKDRDTTDVRTLFASGLVNGGTFNSQATLTCTDGVDTESKNTAVRFEVPEIHVKGTKIDNYYVDGDYTTLQVEGLVEWDKNNWIFSGVEEIGEGQLATTVKMKKEGYPDFKVNLRIDNQIYTIKQLKLDFTIPNNRYKPYSERPTFSSRIEDNIWNKYGLKSSPNLTFRLGYNDDYAQSSESLESGSNDIIGYILASKEAYYNLASQFQTGDKQNLFYSYTNAYGRTIVQKATNLIELDFTESPKSNTEFWNIYAVPNNISGNIVLSDYAIENWNCLKEGMILSTNFQVTATTTPRVWLERSSDKKTWEKFFEFYVEKLDNQDANSFNIPVDVYKLKNKVQDQDQDRGIEQITRGSSDYIRIVVKTDSTENLVENYISDKQQFFFASHTEPLIKFIDVSYEGGEISATYEILDSGSNSNEISYDYWMNIKDIGLIKSESGTDTKTLKFVYTIDDNTTFIEIAPVLKTTLQATTNNTEKTSGFKTERTTQDNNYVYIVCYNLLPTVAYRQNYIGINTNNPSRNGTKDLDNPALTISAYNQQHMIHLVSSNHAASINLQNGSQAGFIIDCGSWDGTPGGVVPSDPQTPTGLARIAYTGEMEDLEQNSDTIIIFSGGSAPEI